MFFNEGDEFCNDAGECYGVEDLEFLMEFSHSHLGSESWELSDLPFPFIQNGQCVEDVVNGECNVAVVIGDIEDVPPRSTLVNYFDNFTFYVKNTGVHCNHFWGGDDFHSFSYKTLKHL